MFSLRTFSRPLSRAYATATGPRALVFIEHNKGTLDSGSLSALTAAEQLGGDVTGILVGSPDHIKQAVDNAKRLKGLNSIIYASSPQYTHLLPETLSPLFEKVLSDSSPFTHVVTGSTSFSKSFLPRLAARLDLPALTDITSLEHDNSSQTTTFTRPIYAGNAINTVKASAAISTKIFTVRGTAFAAAEADEGKETDVKEVEAVEVPDCPTQHIRTTITKSDRPDLGVASRIVSGGRPLKNAETFEKTLYPLADILGAAVGASRAAVDAGYADNSLQVGQTGKVVAPQLYIALGISGAIQHLAGMKDSKMIVAVNKDPEAPIFQVADVGLVGDLYEVVPQIIEKLK